MSGMQRTGALRGVGALKTTGWVIFDGKCADHHGFFTLLKKKQKNENDFFYLIHRTDKITSGSNDIPNMMTKQVNLIL